MVKKTVMKLFVILVFVAFTVFSPLKTEAGEPTEQVKQTVDAVIKILNNKELKKPEKQSERRLKIRETVV